MCASGIKDDLNVGTSIDVADSSEDSSAGSGHAKPGIFDSWGVDSIWYKSGASFIAVRRVEIYNGN